MTAVRQDAATGMSIGTVLDRLRPDFPDVTISKIRFLEAEGLITPNGRRRAIGGSRSRTASGFATCSRHSGTSTCR